MTLPDDFQQYTRQLFGDDIYEEFLHALEQDSPVSIRFNPFKIQRKSCGLAEGQERVPWCEYGVYLSERPSFTFDPLLHAGQYYVQEASSMFVCEVIKQLFNKNLLHKPFADSPLLMLDLCAAPGGKTTALRSVLPDGSLLFSNEPIKIRASILKENIQKFGHPDVVVTNNYPKDYRKSKLMFDVILADVPCSGEGMFRKDPNAISEWSPANVDKCQQLQRSIIEDIWPCLSEGGILVYSTCTFNAKEDEENVQWIAETLGAEFVEIDVNKDWGITGSLVGDIPVYRFIPGKTRGEGIFMAVLKKSGEGREERGERRGSRKEIRSQKVKNNQQIISLSSRPSTLSSLNNWLQGDFALMLEGDTVKAIPSRWAHIYNNVVKALHIIHAGVTLGTVKGKDIIPDTSLALSTALNREAFASAPLSYDEAIQFLRKEAITLDSSIGKGFTLVTYDSAPLGFVKNLGNRANNLYPQEWRIRKNV